MIGIVGFVLGVFVGFIIAGGIIAASKGQEDNDFGRVRKHKN